MRLACVLSLLASSTVSALAANVASVSPQGEVSRVQQVSVAFSAAVATMGDARQADPVDVACTGAPATGQGRWLDARRWVFDFREALPPGSQCRVTLRDAWKPLPGVTIEGRREFSFSTGGPMVLSTRPWTGATIEEDQHFLLTLNGPAAPATLAGRVWCEVDGIGERIAAVPVTGAVRDEIVKSQRLSAAQAARSVLLACQRPLPADTAMRLVWGAGIGAAGNPAVLTRTPQPLEFRVRPRFTAEFSCERERANAACLPIRPMSVQFSSPVPREQALKARLVPLSGAAAIAPVLDPGDTSGEVSGLRFPVPQAEGARFRIELPQGLADVSGRALSNATSFPLEVATGAAPPIAKFAAAPFGILEHVEDTALPVTLRHVQGDLRSAAPGGSVRVRTLDDDADILAWHGRVQKFHEATLTAREAGLPPSQWTEPVRERDERGRMREFKRDREVATRTLSLLKADANARRLDLPALDGGDPRPFEVVGIPLPGPGYHVVEIESRALGAALLDKPEPMYVRTGVLVTNLGVHFKQGRESSLVWVTSLDRGRPVAGAAVVVHDCRGTRLWGGSTDAAGIARVAQPLPRDDGECPSDSGYFVTAHLGRDHAFMFSSWQRGIEGWRFNVPLSQEREPDLRAHTVFDRTLLRAGETVSMKHFVRRETARGLAPLAGAELPVRAVLEHQGSGQRYSVPVAWSGVRSATSSWNIPPAARLGVYDVTLERDAQPGGEPLSLRAGSFRVEEFRVPLVEARLDAPRGPVIAPKELALAIQLQHLSGGGVGEAPVSVSAVLRPSVPSFAGFEEYSFAPPRDAAPAGDDEDADGEPDRLVADRVSGTTDANGAASVMLKDLPAVSRASELRAELTFDDPNGEIQTVATQVPLWPGTVVLGVRTASWASERGRVKLQVAALDTTAKPIRGQAIEVRARLHSTQSTRKRMVGGFYAYDNRRLTQDLGVLCKGSSNGSGLLDCEAGLDRAGQVELVASARDSEGRTVQAARSVWLTGQGELWFAQDNDDRIELLPEKAGYAGGDTARLQLRMPFREATVLVSVEREGVLDARVMTLRGDDPTITLKIDPDWGPNVYVSALALRGRLREVPWYSFFTWGWKGPLEWWRAYRYEGRDHVPPTAMVDLARPSFKLGLARLRVGLDAQRLKVEVMADKAQYQVREKTSVRVRVSRDGKPLAGAELAFAAVDEGLLALAPNRSWALLESLWQERALGVETSTGAGEIIGRRHYGKKAVPAGGGGGRNPTRELFDTLLLWQPRVTLDAQGEARLEVALNDSLTSFRLVAVADAEPARFGTGSASIRVSQDLQMLAGLPPLVREGDRFSAEFTLRNTTGRQITLTATLNGTVNRGSDAAPDLQRSRLALAPQTIRLAAGASQQVRWPVEVPADALSITWEGAVEEAGGAAPAHDRLRFIQAVAPAVPTRVVQATLQQLDERLDLSVQAPAGALADAATQIPRGGVDVGAQPRLSGALPGIRRYFETYPFACLEQKISKAVSLKDAALWQTLAGQLGSYLDGDGLANYFPPRDGDAPRGSDRLTAYVLAATHEAGQALPAEPRDAMLAGLAAFVEGRILRSFWSPRADLDVRKLAAVEALSRYGKARASMLDSIPLEPNRWPTAAVIDWLRILQRLDGVAQRERRREEAQQILRARLNLDGTTLRFSTEDSDFWWWLMDSADANAARLILAVVDEPAWKDDLPRLVLGALARQKRGAWMTTTANLWGSLALDRFSAAFESRPPTGKTVATLGDHAAEVDWGATPDGGRQRLPWPAAGSAPSLLSVEQPGSGKPWITVQSLAAIPLAAPMSAGYSLTRRLTPVLQKVAGRYSRGDTLRVSVEIQAAGDMTWVVLDDPVPAGATILGSGLGRDSEIARRDRGPASVADVRTARYSGASVAYDERGFEAFRRYFEFLPRGRHVVEYTVRLNAVGRFHLPPSRVEALYAPETHGELPVADLEVQP